MRRSPLVRRALMLTGNLGEVALVALTQGEKGLEGIKPELFVPLKPMLAETADNPEEAIKEHGGRTVFEYKFDGARVQIHRLGDEVRIYSRRLSDVTESVPDIVNLVREVPPEGGHHRRGGDNRRRRRRASPSHSRTSCADSPAYKDVQQATEQIPLKLHLFDVLYLDGTLLIDEP